MQETSIKKPNKLHINKPKWLKTKIPTGSTFFKIKKDLKEKRLYTVCEEAKCPNIGECWATNTATFMILGDTCTRACRFCNVKTGNPNGWTDKNEPQKTADSIKIMNLRYAVLTMVDRDDLNDGGAAHVAQVLSTVKIANPDTKLEFLGGDFNGKAESLQKILEAEPEVFAHNLETVRRLSPRVRDARASYDQSLEVLAMIKKISTKTVLTKSAIMVGLGETQQEVFETLRDLRQVDVDIVTIGQYMRPSKRHLAIQEFVTPEQFRVLEEKALDMGFKAVACSPLVRSSYRADFYYGQAIDKLSSK